MRRHRHRHRLFRPAAGAAPLTAAVALLFAVCAGCGNSGGLTSAGATPTAVGPTQLWPSLPPASVQPSEPPSSASEAVPGIKVPGDDVHRLKPADVARADPTTSAYTTAGDVLQPYYRDLTGDNHDELITGITLRDGQLAINCYWAHGGELLRIMDTVDDVISVELAGRYVIIRDPAGLPGYEYRTSWSWDSSQRAMLPTRDEILRVRPQKSPAPLSSARPARRSDEQADPEAAPE
ncbi:hypothetical protein [Streptomyces beijiangensis]|uniref:Lipoprotein n=1 Tax=Streptomyces beijiangensis TaxID=163361 RepID=A0A939JGW8_9ACTN|nr:hypothetical protein [Streptomyces beijiangensis]MBO0513843.1 hypothetical protein [Streptomyces beijiangensis]